jgi:hypothetical protein
MTREELREGALVALGLFVLYALGACRTIYVGDSGELVAAVATLGIPHPSGYPLYVLLGKLFTLLVPLGSIAFRMSLFSAVCAALACAIVYGLCRRQGLGRAPALVAALLLAASPSFWGEANVQRVYALNAIFVAAAAAGTVAWHRGRQEKTILIVFFLCGLGATNHTFMGVCGVMIGAFVVLTEPRLLLRPLFLAKAAGLFVLGLLPYLYLFFRARTSPRLNWGRPDTLERLIAVITRKDFWGRAWISGPADLVPIGLDYLTGLAAELFWVGALLALVGLWAAGKRRWPVLAFALVMAANFLTMALHGSRADIFIWHRYYIPSYVIAAILAGVGAQAILERWGPRTRPVLLLVPALALALHYPEFDRSRYRIADAFSRELLSAVPAGAHLSATDDNILFVLIYLHLVENVRPDLDLILQGVGGADLPPLHFDPDTDPLFMTHHPNWSFEGLEVVPVGLVFRTVRSGRPLPDPVLPAEELPGESDPRVPKDYLTQNLIGQLHYMRGLTFETRSWPRAEHEFERARKAAPENDVLFFNLGLIYTRNGLLEEAERAFVRSHEINPRHLATAGKVRASDKIAVTRAERERVARLERALAARTDAPAGSPSYHRQMAELLAGAGEPAAARGHWLRAHTRPSS